MDDPQPTTDRERGASEDPLATIVRITKDPELSEEAKARLLGYAGSRFRHRRRMAYIALYAVLTSFALLIAATIVDGVLNTQIVSKISSIGSLLGAIEFFLTAIVAAYYGMSTWRPSS